MSVMKTLNQDINKLDEIDNNIIINKNPIKRDFSLQIPKISFPNILLKVVKIIF